MDGVLLSWSFKCTSAVVMSQDCVCPASPSAPKSKVCFVTAEDSVLSPSSPGPGALAFSSSWEGIYRDEWSNAWALGPNSPWVEAEATTSYLRDLVSCVEHPGDRV